MTDTRTRITELRDEMRQLITSLAEDEALAEERLEDARLKLAAGLVDASELMSTDTLGELTGRSTREVNRLIKQQSLSDRAEAITGGGSETDA